MFSRLHAQQTHVRRTACDGPRAPAPPSVPHRARPPAPSAPSSSALRSPGRAFAVAAAAAVLVTARGRGARRGRRARGRRTAHAAVKAGAAGITLGSDVDHVTVDPIPCATQGFQLQFGNAGSSAVYADAFVDAPAPLQGVTAAGLQLPAARLHAQGADRRQRAARHRARHVHDHRPLRRPEHVVAGPGHPAAGEHHGQPGQLHAGDGLLGEPADLSGLRRRGRRPGLRPLGHDHGLERRDEGLLPRLAPGDLRPAGRRSAGSTCTRWTPPSTRQPATA